MLSSKCNSRTIIKGVVDGFQLQINTLQKENEDFKSTNIALTTRIDLLEQRADAAEKYSHRDNLCINRVSENKDENFDKIILDMS
jgi:cell division protein FtsB